jgi:outer membrane immunogenic protein
MRKTSTIVFAAAVVTLGAVGSAFSADIARRAPVYKAPPPPPLPVYNWTGFYVGLNAGAGIDDSKLNQYPTGDFLTDVNAPQYISIFSNSLSSSDASFTGGFTAGYNWQFGSPWLVGIEGDINYLNLSKSVSIPYTYTGALTGSGTNDLSIKNGWFGTVRGRLGWLATPTFLMYGTGGLAVGHTESSVFSTAPTDNVWSGSESKTRTGWTAGGGVEWMFAPKWSAKAEYLYVDLGSQDYALANGPLNSIPTFTQSASADYRYSIVRAGVNYHF